MNVLDCGPWNADVGGMMDVRDCGPWNADVGGMMDGKKQLDDHIQLRKKFRWHAPTNPTVG